MNLGGTSAFSSSGSSAYSSSNSNASKTFEGLNLKSKFRISKYSFSMAPSAKEIFLTLPLPTPKKS